VAIIAILAAIAVPNFLDAQTRAKVTRVVADMRTMHTAIETYRIDNNKAPIRHDDWQNTQDPNLNTVPLGSTKIYDPAVPSAQVGLKTITTPIQYLNSIPIDIFNQPVMALVHANEPGVSNVLDYWDPLQVLEVRKRLNNPVKTRGLGAQGFALLSVGPDQYLGPVTLPAGYPEEPVPLRGTLRHFYDPTNGTTSAGNVYRFSDNIDQRSFWPI
jgi:type II secretory pathway pseudopilin PulG